MNLDFTGREAAMNIRFQPRRHVIDLLFTLALFCVFAASALLVVLIDRKSVV